VTTWLPIATRQTWNRDGGSFTRPPSIICLHSTEGGSWPGYNAGADAPHFTINSKTGEVRQHTPLDRAGRALMHPAGTPETNRAGVIQIEIIGTCDGATASRYNVHYLPDMSDAEAANIRSLLDAIHAATGIPLTSSVSFKQYPASYGANGVRLSRSAFAGYKGVLGHQHVPDNDHGDPGNLPLSKILAVHADTAPSRSVDRPALTEPVKAAPKPATVKLAVDGVFGTASKKRLQQWAGVTQDGVLGRQTWAAVQRKVGVPADGVAGPQTWKAIQRLIGSPADGIPGRATYKALQQYLNQH